MGSPFAISAKVERDSRNEIPTAGTAIQCARSLIQWPSRPMIRNAANGSNGMRAYFIQPLPFHQIEFRDVHGRFASIERDDDREADRHLRRRDREREEHEDLPR